MIDPEYYVGAVRGAGGGWTTTKYSDAAVDGRTSEDDMQVLRRCGRPACTAATVGHSDIHVMHAALLVYLVWLHCRSHDSLIDSALSSRPDLAALQQGGRPCQRRTDVRMFCRE